MKITLEKHANMKLDDFDALCLRNICSYFVANSSPDSLSQVVSAQHTLAKRIIDFCDKEGARIGG